MTDDNNNAQKIAELNDRFRRYGSLGGVPGRMFMTAGVAALPIEAQVAISRMVAGFDSFTPGNDPHGEHEFGSFLVEGAGKLFWKIDYYADSAMEWGSEAPEDPQRCFRVLTIMLADEY